MKRTQTGRNCPWGSMFEDLRIQKYPSWYLSNIQSMSNIINHPKRPEFPGAAKPWVRLIFSQAAWDVASFGSSWNQRQGHDIGTFVNCMVASYFFSNLIVRCGNSLLISFGYHGRQWKQESKTIKSPWKNGHEKSHTRNSCWHASKSRALKTGDG